MDPATILLLFNGALTAFEVLEPKVRDMINKGEVSPEVQAKLKERLAALRGKGAFQGPEWEV